jgi:diaminopimelate decarboxylase
MDTIALADRFGTPLYAFDEDEIRARCRAFRQALQRLHGHGSVYYAAKAGLPLALLPLIADEGLGLDVASAGELAIAAAGRFPMARVLLHGNNKSEDELRAALRARLGLIVIDSLDELERLAAIIGSRKTAILLRLAPALNVETHPALATAGPATKFGLPLRGGQARAAVARALSLPSLSLLGFHCHIGSQVIDAGAYRRAITQVLAFSASMRQDFGFVLRRLNAGGGFGIAYGTRSVPAPARYVQVLAKTLRQEAARHRLPLPELDLEPGRAIVGPPGIALYRVGTRKRAPDGRRIVAVDGGIADNPRPMLYGARYHALLANRAGERRSERVVIAGRYCEAGDIMIPDLHVPAPRAGDVLAVAAAGAYCLAMASNYNGALRPPIVFLRRGRARLVRRRETVADLLRCEAR